ncbi:MAG TPA: hypothetical protein PLO37_24485 [Candidatus Hydrogenedentes bacterium]|nr:hypothetical protein [Candidatus Hydrogenedentota bacterium]HPG70019.1 hypothetical protein [Candidatus Hydrogenedentota bacterium]
MGLLLAVLPMLGAAEEFNAGLDTFPIGIWNYAPLSVFDEAKVQEWQDAGLTLVMGPEYAATPTNIVLMKEVLNWAEKRSIKVIVCDPRTRATQPLPEDFAKGVQEAAKDFAAYPAVFGFHILDEPDTDMFPHVCQAAQMVKAAAPQWHPFVNLLPWYSGVDTRVGFGDWQAYLDTFLKDSGAEFLCYDCYAQMNPGQGGWPMYFKNLNEYREAAQRNGVPFWTTILSVGHFHYRCPSEDDLRWQLNTSVAYGAQGILYFFFYMREPHDNYRLSPIDEFWERTDTFEWMSRTNRLFLKRFGRLFLDLRFEKAMQWPEPVEGCLPFQADDILREVRTDGNRALIVSRFVDKDSRPWVVMVNNSTEESTHATLVLEGADTKVHTVNWDAREQPADVQRGEDCVNVSHWLAPGQMEVYRVEP